MKKEDIVLIWFTGVISQFNPLYCDIPNLRINHDLLERIKTFKADKYVAIINVRNDTEKSQYIELIRKEGLEDKLLFVFCTIDVDRPYFSAIETLNEHYNIKLYVDTSIRRLGNMRIYDPTMCLMHLSQLLT